MFLAEAVQVVARCRHFLQTTDPFPRSSTASWNAAAREGRWWLGPVHEIAQAVELLAEIVNGVFFLAMFLPWPFLQSVGLDHVRFLESFSDRNSRSAFARVEFETYRHAPGAGQWRCRTYRL
jgi:hypothetical protein